MKKLLGLLLFSTSMLVGCNQMRPQQTYTPSPAAPLPESRADIIRKANQAAADCDKQNRESQNGQIVTSDILVMTDAQQNKYDLLASKARLNEKQKKALKQLLAESNRCRNMRLEANRGTAYYALYEKDNATKDIIYGKLLGGQMTVGDANTALKENVLKITAEFKALSSQATTNNAVQQAPSGPGNVIGQTFDSQANGNIFLYDGPCRLGNYSSNYPLRWDAKRADNGVFIGEGCYSLNQQTQQVFMVATTGNTAVQPLSNFQGGGNKSVFQSFSEGLQRATTYWNNSAAQTQNSTTNLTGGTTGGNRMNCQPDGRGGYNCR